MSFKLSNHRFKSKEIKPFLDTSFSVKTAIATIYYKHNVALPKFAIIAPKHLGNATIRNKCRRRFREIITKNIDKIVNDVSIIIIATKKCPNSSFKYCHDMVLLNLKKKNLLYENN